jgi:hypothetical protein
MSDSGNGLNNMVLDNINIRVSSLEYKFDVCDTKINDVKQDLSEAKEERKVIHTKLDKIEEKVLKNGKTRISDWVQIILLIAITIIGIIFGV